MSLAPAVAPAELERKHPESAARESPVQDTAFHSLSGVFGPLGANGSDENNSHLAKNFLLQRRGNGETRTLVMRRLQQGAGNHKTQQFVAQLRRSVVIQRECACGGTCLSCHEKGIPEEEEEPQALQRQPSGAGAGGGTVDAGVIPSDSPGQPLDRSTREFMEPRFGHDFSDVRVHTDSRAAQSAEAFAADAYTAGRDIYFAAGKYAPGFKDGQHLLAHELTHTVQQLERRQPSSLASGKNGSVTVSAPNDPLEQGAERTADAVMARPPADFPLATTEGTIAKRPRGSIPSTADFSAVLFHFDQSKPIQFMQNGQPYVQRKTKLATVLSPPAVAMSVGIDGMTFDIPPEFSYADGSKSLQLFAMILARLVGPQYTPELAEEVDGYFRQTKIDKSGGFKQSASAKAGEKPQGSIVVLLDASLKLIKLLDKKKLQVQLTAEQRDTLVLGVANVQLWQDVVKQSREDNLPLPAWYDESFFVVEMSSQGGLLRKYASAAIRFARTDDDEALLQRYDVATEVLSAILDSAEVLEEIRKDTSLAKLDKVKDTYAALFVLPDPISDPVPVPTAIRNREVATLFLGYVRTQKNLADEAVASSEARAKLLSRFSGFTADLIMQDTAKAGAVTLREVPAEANHPPFGSTISPTPNLSGPLFDAALGTDHMFTMQIDFPDVYAALGRYSFYWERVRIPDDQIGKPVDVDKIAGEEATNWEVATVRFGRATRYAKEDIASTIENMQSDLGAEGIGAPTLVAANAILRYIGEGVRFALESLTTPLDAKHIVFPEAGLYMVRGIMSAVLEGDEAIVRVPSVAYYPVLAREPEEMAKGGVKSELDHRSKAKDRIAEIDKLLQEDALDPDHNLKQAEREALINERDGLKASIGSLSDVLENRKRDLEKRIKDIQAGKDQGDLQSVEKQLKDVEKVSELRQTRKTEGAELLIASFASDLGQKISLSLEVVDKPKTGDMYHVYVSDVTTPKSGAEPGSGKTRNDAIRAAVKEILGGINGYGRGYASVYLDGEPETIRIAASKGALLMEAVENVATAISVAAIAAAPFTGGASMVLLIPAGIAGAVPSAYRVYEKVEAGTWEWSLENAMDLVNIVGSVVGLGRAASASLKWVRMGKGLLVVGYGVEGLNGVLMTANIMEQIDQLQSLEKGQREAALLLLMGQTMLQAGIMVGGKLEERAQQQHLEAQMKEVMAGKTAPPDKGFVIDHETGKITEAPPSIESKVEKAFAADTKDQQMARLGPMDGESRTRLEANPELRKALVESEFAMRMLKKCASSCFPEEMTPEQVRRLETLLRRIQYMGGESVDEDALKKFLYDRREDLAAAVTTLEGTKDASSLNAWLKFYNTGGEERIKTVKPKESPAAIFERTERAHDHGVKFGKQQAQKDNLRDVGFKNPFETQGAFGQGFDDIRKLGGLLDSQLANGDIYVAEYKGGEARLSEGQGELDWVIKNIRRLYTDDGDEGRVYAQQLARALREGRLKGIAYSTPLTDVTHTIKTWDYGKVNIKL